MGDYQEPLPIGITYATWMDIERFFTLSTGLSSVSSTFMTPSVYAPSTRRLLIWTPAPTRTPRSNEVTPSEQSSVPSPEVAEHPMLTPAPGPRAGGTTSPVH